MRASFDEKLDALIERLRALAADFLAPMPSEDHLERELLSDVLDGSGQESSTFVIQAIGKPGVRTLTWDRFEALAALLFEKQGARVVLTPKTCDEGIDVLAIRERRVDLVQCKHTVWQAAVDADVIAELIQAFDGYRAKRFRGSQGRVVLRGTILTNGSPTAAARQRAAEYGIQICAADELARLLEAHPCTAAEIEVMNSRRYASMREVQAEITRLLS